MSELEDLKAKLVARKGRPGYRDSVAELERRIDLIENGTLRYRSAKTGRYVTDDFARENPDTTYPVRQ